MSSTAPKPNLSRLTVGSGEAAREIAVAHLPAPDPARPTLVWLGGYRSDMAGTKAVAIEAHAADAGLGCVRFDYSGHGRSGGAFRDGTISRWLEESLAVIERCVSGPMILVGSSMGGWIALRAIEDLRRRGQSARIAGLVLIAPAPDFTAELIEPQLTERERIALAEQGFFEEPTPYGPEPNVFTRALIEDGRDNRVLTGTIVTGCPVHILQGMADPDVPHALALKLVEHLPADNVTLTLIRDGDHRLSRPADLKRLRQALDDMVAG
ncbi:alpha/beta hydrolase [Ensifer soli]|uniref:alpha/beta hydrolase n=1 Tax=Ciceribacter sp. sgz301302 TaxID=3342379 RepID=UPI0035B9401C